MSDVAYGWWALRIGLAASVLGVAMSSHLGCASTDVVSGEPEPCASGLVRPCFPGPPTEAGIGQCQQGEQQCVSGTWSDCLGYLLAADEVCGNDKDENCNGVADDGCSCDPGQPPKSCYSGPPATRGVGACADGIQPCVGGAWSTDCEQQVLPSNEICDQLDNDCNGLVDEGCGCTDGTTQPCYGGPAGTLGVGECRAGSQSCVGGQWSGACAGQVVPAGEICNGHDDDCDGLPDDGDPGGGSSCPTGLQGLCAQGTWHCQSDSLACVPNHTPSSETCDGQDENCNGQTDDGTFLPGSYDSIEYIPQGWFGFSAGVLLTWGNHVAIWDFATSAVTWVATLAEAWNAVSTVGSQPPTSAVSSVLLVPAGLLGATDSLWVAMGSQLYWYDSGAPSLGWQTGTVSAVLGTPGLDSIEASTIFYPAEVLPAYNNMLLFIVTSAQQVWVLGAGNPIQLTVAQAFCPPGSTNCPSSVQALARVPSSPTATVVIESNGVTYASPFLWDGNGQLYFTWTSLNVGTISCAH